MPLSGKMTADVEIKPPVDKVYEFYTCIPYLMSKSSPDKILSVDLREGQWGKDGSVYCWNFLLCGNAANNKVKVGMDYENNSATYETIEGTLLNMFKSFKISLQVTQKDQGSLVHWTLEYEKLNENVSEPNSMLQITVDSCKDVDAYLSEERSPQQQYN